MAVPLAAPSWLSTRTGPVGGVAAGLPPRLPGWSGGPEEGPVVFTGPKNAPKARTYGCDAEQYECGLVRTGD
jgi:hypothetical protein